MLRVLVVVLLAGTVLSAYLSMSSYGKDAFEIGSYSANIVLALIQVGALILIYSQLKHQKQLSVAQFISSIMEQLASQRDFHRKLENYLKDDSGELDIDNADIVAFLNVFENLAALIESGVINIDDIDQPFAYRFFLTVNNRVVQDLELIRDGKYYKSIYRLHKTWRKFRKAKDLPQIGKKEDSLDYRCEDYGVLAQSESPSNKLL
ncbi:hypothetical protein [Pseudoalteromonas xiamenensis]